MVPELTKGIVDESITPMPPTEGLADVDITIPVKVTLVGSVLPTVIPPFSVADDTNILLADKVVAEEGTAAGIV